MQGATTQDSEWASTHPDPASRVQTAATWRWAGITNRDTFLTRIDGMIYGDDPAKVCRGSPVPAPDLRLVYRTAGLLHGQRHAAVSINGQSGQAQLTLAPYNGNLEAYIGNVFQGLGGQQAQLRPTSIQRTTVNGIPAAYGTARVNSGNGQVDVVVFAYEFANDRAYHFQAITPAGRASAFTPMFNSMRRISSSEAAAIIPRRIDVVTVRSGDTVQSLASRMAYDRGQIERFRVLNSLDGTQGVTAGQKVKIVVRGR